MVHEILKIEYFVKDVKIIVVNVQIIKHVWFAIKDIFQIIMVIVINAM